MIKISPEDLNNSVYNHKFYWEVLRIGFCVALLDDNLETLYQIDHGRIFYWRDHMVGEKGISKWDIWVVISFKFSF